MMKTLIVEKIPESVFLGFKSQCVEQGKTMREVIQNFMKVCKASSGSAIITLDEELEKLTTEK